MLRTAPKGPGTGGVPPLGPVVLLSGVKVTVKALPVIDGGLTTAPAADWLAESDGRPKWRASTTRLMGVAVNTLSVTDPV